MRLSRASRAVFLDRDGTLIEHVPYLAEPRLVRVLPGVPEALSELASRGFLLFVVSNQSGVGRGYMSYADVMAVHTAMIASLEAFGVAISDFRYCVHTPEDGCQCRKPAPGSLLSLAALHGVTLERSWMVGDTVSDVEAGEAAGCRTVLVESAALPDGTAQSSALNLATVVSDTLRTAAREILRREDA